MAFRFQYGTKAVAEAGLAAGQAMAAREEYEQQMARDRQAMAIAAQAASQRRSQEHAIEMTEFRDMLGQEAEKRAQAWELEKMQIRSEGALRREQEEEDFYSQRQLARRAEEEDKLNAKLKAIDDSDILSDRQKAQMKLQVQTGIRLSESTNPLAAFMQGGVANASPEVVKHMREIGKKEQVIASKPAEAAQKLQPSEEMDVDTKVKFNYLKSSLLSRDLNSAEKKTVQKTLVGGDPDKIAALYETVLDIGIKPSTKELLQGGRKIPSYTIGYWAGGKR